MVKASLANDAPAGSSALGTESLKILDLPAYEKNLAAWLKEHGGSVKAKK